MASAFDGSNGIRHGRIVEVRKSLESLKQFAGPGMILGDLDDVAVGPRQNPEDIGVHEVRLFDPDGHFAKIAPSPLKALSEQGGPHQQFIPDLQRLEMVSRAKSMPGGGEQQKPDPTPDRGRFLPEPHPEPRASGASTDGFER